MKFDAIGDLIDLEHTVKRCRLSVVEQQGKRHRLIRALIDWRLEERKKKNFEISDKIRDILLAQGIEVTDTPFGHGQLITDIYTEE